MSRRMERYGPFNVPNTFAPVHLVTVPAGKKFECVSVFLQTNGAAGFNATLAQTQPGGLYAFFWHDPAVPAGPAVVSYELKDFTLYPPDRVTAAALGPTAVNYTLIGVMVDDP